MPARLIHPLIVVALATGLAACGDEETDIDPDEAAERILEGAEDQRLDAAVGRLRELDAAGADSDVGRLQTALMDASTADITELLAQQGFYPDGGRIPVDDAGAEDAGGQDTATELDCAAREFASGGECVAWTDCSAGSFVAQPGTDMTDRACVPCPDGTYSSEENATACTELRDCDLGTFVSAAPSLSSDRECSVCATGTTTEPNAVECSPFAPCPAGEFREEGLPACQDCPPGHWCSGPGEPVRCPAGTWDGGDGVACLPHTDCPGGTLESAAPNASTDRSCEPCPSGQFSIGPNVKECQNWTACRAGSFVAEAGTPESDRVCADCAAGSHSSATNATNCVPSGCPAGTYQVTASTQSTAAICELCPAGSYCPGGPTPPSACGPNEWDGGDTSMPCEPQPVCPAGTQVLSAASPTTQRTCQACPAGSYSEAENAARCTPHEVCRPGSYVVDAGTPTTDRVCGPCEGGHYSATDNAPECKPWTVCPANGSESRAPSTTNDRVCACLPDTSEGKDDGDCNFEGEEPEPQ